MRRRGVSVIRGSDTIIEAGAAVTDSVLWDNVVVESGARLSNAVLGDNVRIPGGSAIERAVVVRREIVKEIERGEVIGENLIVPIE